MNGQSGRQVFQGVGDVQRSTFIKADCYGFCQFDVERTKLSVTPQTGFDSVIASSQHGLINAFGEVPQTSVSLAKCLVRHARLEEVVNQAFSRPSVVLQFLIEARLLEPNTAIWINAATRFAVRLSGVL